MNHRSIWMTIFILVLAGLVKAQWHFIKLAMLGGMGLGGLWMIHKLAQDFNKIRNPKSADLSKFISKRSLGDDLDSSLSADFNSILLQDHVSCAQRTLCQIAASPRKMNGLSERNILKFIRHVSRSEGDSALDAFKTAVTLGASSEDLGVCARAYPKCPHSRQQIREIFRF